MNILWLTWKDRLHPDAGGAEVVAQELCRRLLADGHSVTMLTARYPGSAKSERLDGMTVVRIGSSRYLHPFQALSYYMRHLRGRFDIVIEEVQGAAPYFAVFFGRYAKRFLFYHQLGRRNWLHEIKPPFSFIGYGLLVPAATWLISKARVPVITVSESTRQTLARHGLQADRTHIISEGLHDIQPLTSLDSVKKYDTPTILSHGSMRSMKRTIDQIKAFELAKQTIPNLCMKISGSASGKYGKQVMRYIARSRFAKDISYEGRTTQEQKMKLMQRSHLLLVTSVEEGWGLIVTEANSQGTPAVVYDVDGLRDSVRHDETGLVMSQNPADLATGVVSLLQDSSLYERFRQAAWKWSKQITFDQSYRDFKRILEIA